MALLSALRLDGQTNAPGSSTNYTQFKDIASFIAAARSNETVSARLQGVITYRYRQSSIFMQDDTAGVFVSSATNVVLELGDIVEVTGRSVPAGFSPVLQQDSLRKSGEKAVPEAVETNAKEIMTGKHDMMLVELEGTLLEVMPRPDRTTVLRLLDGTVPFHAELDSDEFPQAWNAFVPHSVLQLRGVCSIAGNDGLVRSFRILLRTGEDAEVVRAPPWWTFQRTMRVVIVLGLLILAGLIWVAALNHQVRQQTRELRTRLEREAELEDQYHELFENAQELVFTLNQEGQFLSLNKAAERTLGMTRFAALEKSFADFILPEQRKRFLQFLDGARHAASKLGEFVVRSADGRQASLELSCHLLNRPKAPTEFQVIARDISERKQAEAEIHQLTHSLERRVAERTSQLEVANKELEAFSYSVSHDLRAPLRAIDGFSRILIEENLKNADEDTRHLLDGVQKNAKRMARLIDDLLQFSRLTRSSLVAGEVNVESMIQSAVTEQRALFPERKIELVMQQLPVVRGDESMLRQVVENLVSNAVKYSRNQEVSRIEIGARDTETEDVIFVRDNGVGFDMRYADKLFEVFQRLHSDREFEGTGVGLAIVQRVIQRHGGRVWAEAESGKGATFFFSLPKIPVAENA